MTRRGLSDDEVWDRYKDGTVDSGGRPVSSSVYERSNMTEEERDDRARRKSLGELATIEACILRMRAYWRTEHPNAEDEIAPLTEATENARRWLQ